MAMYGSSEEENELRCEEKRPRVSVRGIDTPDAIQRANSFSDSSIKRTIDRAADIRTKSLPTRALGAGNPIAKLFSGLDLSNGLSVKVGLRGPSGGMLSLTRKF